MHLRFKKRAHLKAFSPERNNGCLLKVTLFHSIDYGVFLIVVFVISWGLLRRRLTLRHAFLLAASYFFYMSWNAVYALLIGFSTLLDYVIGRRIHYTRSLSQKRWLLVPSIGVNLGILGVFKYYNFFLDNLNGILNIFDLLELKAYLQVLLPVGISFYTFQSMSYSIDIYRGELKPAKNFIDFVLFVAFSPQLVAGPIVRASQFLPQLEHRPKYSDAVNSIILDSIFWPQGL